LSLNLILTASLLVLPRLLGGGEAEIVQTAPRGGKPAALHGVNLRGAGGIAITANREPATEANEAHEAASSSSIPPPLVWKNTAHESWTPEIGDIFLVDVSRNMGTIVHRNGETLNFPVITGQQRVVSYIGLRYNAETPRKSWTVLSHDTQSDRITYGKSGRFFRLYDRGTRTHYGIHAHRYEAIMFARENRYQSMGCIIVEEHILDILERTFHLNGDTLFVRTYGHGTEMIASTSVQKEG
jgi:hypothetical protein